MTVTANENPHNFKKLLSWQMTVIIIILRVNKYLGLASGGRAEEKALFFYAVLQLSTQESVLVLLDYVEILSVALMKSAR